MTQLHTPPLFELKAAPEGLLEGYASTFNGFDSYGDSVLPGAFAATLEKHRAARTTPAMLWCHESSRPVGRWEAIAEDARGLHVRGRLNLKTDSGREAYEHVRAGDLNGLSIGYSVAPGGAERRSDVTLLTALVLHEVSIVSMPADDAARVSSIKALGEPPATVREFESALMLLGYSRRLAGQIAAKGFGPADTDADAPGYSQIELVTAQLAVRELMQIFRGKS